MCRACRGSGPRSRLLKARSDAEQSAEQSFLEEFVRLLEQWHADLITALRSGALHLMAAEAARRTVARTLDGHQDAFQASFDTLWTETASAARTSQVRRYDLDADTALPDQVTRELREYAANSWSATSETMIEKIASALRDAHDAGLSNDQMADILQEDVFPDMRQYEADRAARTAATGAAGRGAVSSYRDAGVPGKEWLATGPPYERTRESHEEIDGQVVPVGAKFTTGAGNQAWWPGDPRLPPSDFISCRCSVAPAWDLP